MPWSDADEARLAFLWGERDLDEIAKTLKRSAHAVTRRASELQLGPPSAGGKTMNALARSSGYSISRILFAVSALGLRLNHRRRSSPEQKSRIRSFCISEDQEEAICEFLKKQPDGMPLLRADSKKTPVGVWGIGTKPPACTDCGRSDRPHFAKGKCKVCYHRSFKKARQRDNGELTGKFWARFKIQAKRHKIGFSLSMSEGWSLYVKQGRKCALTGDSISLSESSLARVDAALDFTIDNTVWVRRDIAAMKGEMSFEHFLAACRAVVKHVEQHVEEST